MTMGEAGIPLGVGEGLSIDKIRVICKIMSVKQDIF
jgi:hypothetical protein